ncbi:vitamin K epoxide reductase family protein [Pseudonocardia sichuanensis]
MTMTPHPTAAPACEEPRAPLVTRAIGWILTGAGGIGTLAAFALILDRIALLEDPAHVPSCSINPLLSCGPVMDSPQAEVFGFPNPLIGLVAFPVVATTGIVVLAGVALPRWYWLGMQAGTTAGVVFVHWLIAQSLYRIGALCPYCIAVWIVTITAFWYLTLHNLATARSGVPSRWRRAGSAVASYHSALLVGWFLLIAGLIANAFWSYWVSLLGP